MAELADALDLGSSGETRGGSNPPLRTIFFVRGYGGAVRGRLAVLVAVDAFPMLFRSRVSASSCTSELDLDVPQRRRQIQGVSACSRSRRSPIQVSAQSGDYYKGKERLVSEL